MAKYYCCYIHEDDFNRGTEKAIKIDYIVGQTNYGEYQAKWLPRSIIKVGRTTDVGAKQVFIPVWFFKKNKLNKERFFGIDFKARKIEGKNEWTDIWEF